MLDHIFLTIRLITGLKGWARWLQTVMCLMLSHFDTVIVSLYHVTNNFFFCLLCFIKSSGEVGYQHVPYFWKVAYKELQYLYFSTKKTLMAVNLSFNPQWQYDYCFLDLALQYPYHRRDPCSLTVLKLAVVHGKFRDDSVDCKSCYYPAV